MDCNQIIKSLIELESYFEEGRKKAYTLRTQLELTNSSTPLEQVDEQKEEAKLANLLGSRKKENGHLSDKTASAKKTEVEKDDVVKTKN